MRNLQRQLDDDGKDSVVTKVQVSVSFPSAAQARAAVKALIPDNVNLPSGLTIDIFSKGKLVNVRISGYAVSLVTVASTLDEILEHISVAKKVMQSHA